MTKTTKIIPTILLSSILIGAAFASIDIQPAIAQPPFDVLVVESTDASTSRQSQLDSKFVPSAGTTISGTGDFILTSLGPTGLAALTCSQIQTFDVVYVPITSAGDTASRDAIKNNPAFAQCFTSTERAVINGYHAEDHSQPATGQFLFDALTWIDGGSQVGLLVLNDVRSSPQKYDFLQPMFPGVFASVQNVIVPYQDITFLTTPPHPIHANTSDGVQNLASPTMDNWGQTCHTIWNTLGSGNGGYEDDGFGAVSQGSSSGQGPDVCAIAKESRVTPVDVDIKPGSDPSSVNCKKSVGVVPIAIIGSNAIDLSTIDLSTLQINGVPVTEAHDKNHVEGVDTVLHIEKAGICDATQNAPLKVSVQVTLTGSTTDGDEFEGTADIRIVKR